MDYRLLLLLCVALTGGCANALHSQTFHNDSGVLPENLPFSEAVEVDGMIYLSGQLGVKPGALELIPGGIEAQAEQTLKNIETVLLSLGLDRSNLVKCTVMLADMQDWPKFNAVYARFLSTPYPARSAFATAGLALGAKVEVECIAKRP